ncbi:MAG TPA: TrmH family RNA methyltransferase [Candidatus Sulfotelmatobacter sp.]|nr:TrmH family RNA methyltransferase [Candidatus Sulfotelmatobacter sp.]
MPLCDLNNLVVVLVRPRNPLNIGAAARAMSNFGAHRLRVVNPYRLAFREARSAVGGSALLKQAEEFDSVSDAVADCTLVVGTTAVRDRKLDHPPKILGENSAEIIRSTLTGDRVALLFGSEKIGLTNDDFSYCHWLMTITTHSQNISMNLGQAVAVCLYELARNVRPERKQEQREVPTAEALEQITTGLLEALHISGYVKPGTDKMFEKKARQLILRMNLEAYDAKLLLGMVRQIVWKLRQSGK